MGTRENTIEKYFDNQVRYRLKGISRKWENRHHCGVPDRIPIYPGCPGQVFVEIKTEDGKLTPVQIREHERLREAGALVFTLYGKDGVNEFIKLAEASDLERVHNSWEIWEL